jgi:hypothetical protein
VRVYHFTSAKHGLADVRLRQLKIATLADINDPFELAVCCNDRIRRQALRETRRDWANRFGMLCFSGDWHNPVQWSHYADKHRGLCLGFDVPDTLLTPVKYAKRPPQLNWDAIESGSELGTAQMIRWSSTKFEHWAYENERRLFLALEDADEKGRYFADFGDALALREVIIGPESSVTRGVLQSVLNGLVGVEARKTRLAFRGYKVVTQHDLSMWP